MFMTVDDGSCRYPTGEISLGSVNGVVFMTLMQTQVPGNVIIQI